MSQSLNQVLQSVIATNNALMAYLQETKDKADTQPAELPKTDWRYASTTLVTKYTGEQYNWHKLAKYCKEHNLAIKREKIDRLELNSYPATAWYQVYGVALGRFE